MMPSSLLIAAVTLQLLQENWPLKQIRVGNLHFSPSPAAKHQASSHISSIQLKDAAVPGDSLPA